MLVATHGTFWIIATTRHGTSPCLSMRRNRDGVKTYYSTYPFLAKCHGVKLFLTDCHRGFWSRFLAKFEVRTLPWQYHSSEYHFMGIYSLMMQGWSYPRFSPSTQTLRWGSGTANAKKLEGNGYLKNCAVAQNWLKRQRTCPLDFGAQ